MLPNASKDVSFHSIMLSIVNLAQLNFVIFSNSGVVTRKLFLLQIEFLCPFLIAFLETSTS